MKKKNKTPMDEARKPHWAVPRPLACGTLRCSYFFFFYYVFRGKTTSVRIFLLLMYDAQH